MKKIIFALSLAFAMANIQAQNYQISFAGIGASTTVDSVKVENLTQCTSVNLGGSDTLHLDVTMEIKDIDASNENALDIYPNPMTEYSNIEFESPVSGNVTIKIYDITGKKIIQTQNNLQQGKHRYQISGISSGVYIIQINSEAYSYMGKIISNCKGVESPNITYQKQSTQTKIQSNTKNAKIREAKGTNSIIQMQYNTGDRLKITGISGMYQTIFMIVPASSQIITFNFVSCTDGDGNNYSVVQIGTQVWMAENLKTTKYSEGTSIPNVTDNTQWSNLTTGAYCNYNNTTNTDTINTYGRLYNWYAVDDSRDIAPAGWHVPTDTEWTTLTTYLGGTFVAGGKMKENCTTLWASPNTGATNESGFSGLPGGNRWNSNGVFYHLGSYGNLWSATQYDVTNAWLRSLSFDNSTVAHHYTNKSYGVAVRCLKD